MAMYVFNILLNYHIHISKWKLKQFNRAMIKMIRA